MDATTRPTSIHGKRRRTDSVQEVEPPKRLRTGDDADHPISISSDEKDEIELGHRDNPISIPSDDEEEPKAGDDGNHEKGGEEGNNPIAPGWIPKTPAPRPPRRARRARRGRRAPIPSPSSSPIPPEILYYSPVEEETPENPFEDSPISPIFTPPQEWHRAYTFREIPLAATQRRAQNLKKMEEMFRWW